MIKKLINHYLPLVILIGLYSIFSYIYPENIIFPSALLLVLATAVSIFQRRRGGPAVQNIKVSTKHVFFAGLILLGAYFEIRSITYKNVWHENVVTGIGICLISAVLSDYAFAICKLIFRKG